MASNIRMDSHKLIYHPRTVANWLEGKNIYPIEIEISPSGACNHRCVFCAVDYIGYKPNFLNKDIILRDIRHMSTRGLKSVICSGEGEPLLNKDMPEIANKIKECGVDVAMSTNGVLFTEDKAKECLAAFTWIRFSIASMEEVSYNAIQRGQAGDLDRVKTNLAHAVRIKKEHGFKTTLGVQCLLMTENAGQLPSMAKQLREIGVDYLTVKPYSQHKHSENHQEINYESLLALEQELRQYTTEDFAIYFRANAMRKMHHDKPYKVCHGLPFMTHIDSAGNVWPCVAHIGAREFCYGNIYEQPFEEIWNGDKRRQVVEKMRGMDVNKICREACRLDEINKYLDELKHPGEHVNFI
ncbi:MAG: radical SAM protein [Fretibacterium sp.]|nr:radical SAM protein [Fretibacterium sp.]